MKPPGGSAEGSAEGVTDEWFAGDTGASDVFANANGDEKAVAWHQVNVTNGKKELLFENDRGEIMVDGTQLLPIGKCARGSWLAGLG